ncbi:MAG: alpha,alpha-trehalase [Clostridia bacterium]|nr:alpha,alpha-trehalase [Clostridia bacterium]
MSKAVLDYIEKNWDSCQNENRVDIEAGTATLYGLPYPYSIPAVGHFDEMYYWDTYFANQGLMLADRWWLVKNNTDNILYMIERFGFMKNSNRFFHAGLCQPPFASRMVRECFDHYKDKTWLYGAFNTLKSEYNFWMTERMTKIGLNQYRGKNVDKTTEQKAGDFIRRSCSGKRPEGLTDQQIVDHYMVCCESGWDCNPRWDGFHGPDFVQVELNSLLYDWEKNMAYFSEVLGMGEEEKWEKAAATRKELMYKYLINEDGVMIDYNIVTGKHSQIFSSCSFYPLFVGLADEKLAAATLAALPKIECEYGLASCEKNVYSDTHLFQWNYPIGWSCQQHLVVKALDNYGFKEDAARCAAKYMKLIEKVHAETGKLWEKYNVVEGSNNVLSKERTESMPAMMGWTAGAYLTCKRYVEEGIID